LLATIVCLLVAILAASAAAEDYLVTPEAPLFVRAVPTRPDTPDNRVAILSPGESAVVLACVNYKSDIALKIRTDTGWTGYISEGSFHLEKGRFPARLLMTDPTRVVWSCRGFYDHLKRPAS